MVTESFDLSKADGWKKLEDLKTKVVILGFESDEGVSRNNGRVGAKNAPDEIRAILHKMPKHFCEEPFAIGDAGNIRCEGDLEDSQVELGNLVSKLLALNIMPIVLGGGHETAFGHYLGIHTLKCPNLGIINFDAHLDMRPLAPEPKVSTSGTPFLQIAKKRHQDQLPFNYTCIGLQMTGNADNMLKTMREWQVNPVFARECFTEPDRIKDTINYNIKNYDALYVSVCLDAFAAAFAPGVSAPTAHGLMPWQVILPLQQLAQSGKVIALDIVELAPNYDENHKTARLAASLVAEFLYYLKFSHNA